eukprot:scaffold220499_cov30-Tisochrysis_lutea.AAC.2
MESQCEARSDPGVEEGDAHDVGQHALARDEIEREHLLLRGLELRLPRHVKLGHLGLAAVRVTRKQHPQPNRLVLRRGLLAECQGVGGTCPSRNRGNELELRVGAPRRVLGAAPARLA